MSTTSPTRNAGGKRRRIRLPIFDRGPRPLMRGWLHAAAAVFFAVAGLVQITLSAVYSGPVVLVATIVYVLCLVGSMGVSALYHQGRWRHESTVRLWRRADHAMIAVFIAGTYGPVVTASLPTGTAVWVLTACWVGAAAAVALNLKWIHHPRWLDVVVYLFLGWLIVAELPALWASAGPAVVVLLLAGGVVYSLGAVVYGLKWPDPSKRFFGFHEVFHAAVIVAAILHNIAIWLVIL